MMEATVTYTITLLVEHEGSNGPTGVGTGTGLATDMNNGVAPAILILSTGNGAGGHRHDKVSGSSEEVGITKVVDGGTTSHWRSLYPVSVRTIPGPERTDHLTQLRVQPHIHHRASPLLCLISQWRYEHAPSLVTLTHMMLLIHQRISIYSS